MARKKVTLAYIRNDSQRRTSFRKRKKGLIKKVSELSTLCGVDACAIIYSQYEAEPEVWPSRASAQAVLERLRRMPAMEQTRKMDNQESLNRQRIDKSNDKLRRVKKENKLRQIERYLYTNMYGLDASNVVVGQDAADMVFVVNEMLGNINSRMDVLKKDARMQQQQIVAAPMETSFDLPVLEGPTLMTAQELEGFPWNLVQSPPCGRIDDYGFGWDDEPYPFMFNDGAADTSGSQPGNRESLIARVIDYQSCLIME